jgi:hypothetical protein
MVKFRENDHDGYERVRYFLQEFVKHAIPTIESRLRAFSKGPKREMHKAEKGKIYIEGI